MVTRIKVILIKYCLYVKFSKTVKGCGEQVFHFPQRLDWTFWRVSSSWVFLKGHSMSFPEEFGLLNYTVHMNAIYCCCAQLYEEPGAAVNLPPFISCWLSSDRRANTKKKRNKQKKKKIFRERRTEEEYKKRGTKRKDRVVWLVYSIRSL